MIAYVKLTSILNYRPKRGLQTWLLAVVGIAQQWDLWQIIWHTWEVMTYTLYLENLSSSTTLP